MIDLVGIHVVAIFSHPDDEAFTTGGVLAAFADRGAAVTLICATRGEQGEIAHPSLASPENLGQVREQELRDAASILGIHDVRLLDYRDSGMFGTPSNEDPAALIQHSTTEVATELISILKDIHPDLVITFTEDGGYLHPDHVHIHESVVTAAQRSPEIIPQLYFASFPREFFLHIANQNHGAFAGMTEERRQRMGQPLESFTIVANVEPYFERKTLAFAAHKTQQPKQGEHPFLESDEARRLFGFHEYYRQAPWCAGANDPLALLVSDLEGSTVRTAGQSLPTAP